MTGYMGNTRVWIQFALVFVICFVIRTGEASKQADETSSDKASKSQKTSGLKSLKKYLEDRGVQIQDIPKAVLIYEGISLCFM